MHSPDQLDSPRGRELLAVLRQATARLPEVEEVVDGFGHTTFKVGSRSFVIAGMVDWAEVAQLIEDGYRRAAPKRLLKLLPPE
jgi:hypothetical protein